MKQFLTSTLLALLILGVFQACEESPGIGPLYIIEVNPPAVNMEIDSTQQFTATGRDVDMNVLPDLTFTWTSRYPLVGAINESGLLSCLSEGTTMITAKSGSVESTEALVNVYDPVFSIALSPATLTIDCSAQITATAKDMNGDDITGLSFIWESDNTNIASVADNGQVVGIGTGTTSITASLREVTSLPLTVTVNGTFQKPSAITATAISANTLELNWNDNSSCEEGFIIERDGGSGFDSLTVVGSGITQYLDSDLDGSASYTYRVAGFISSYISDWSTGSVSNLAPQSPTNLSASSISDTEIELSWADNCSFETGFKIERDAGSGFTELGTVSADVTEYTDTGLTVGQNYDYRVAAYTASNTSDYSATVTISITEPMVDYDGNVYQTIIIGDQEWMAENLKVTHYRDGTAITNVTDNGAWAALTTEAYCIFNNNASNEVDTYGALYNWYAVTDAHNLAPEGWHVPTDEEWTELENYLGANAGDKLKSTSGWYDNGNGTDDYGFTALPGGYRSNYGYYNFLGFYGSFWSSTESNSYYALYRRLVYDNSSVGRHNNSKKYGFSIRCIRD